MPGVLNTSCPSFLAVPHVGSTGSVLIWMDLLSPLRRDLILHGCGSVVVVDCELPPGREATQY